MTDSSDPAFCRGCGSDAGQRFGAAEMMFRIGESFTYFRCDQCQSISRVGTPEDLSKYYDSDQYYSFSHRDSADASSASFRKRLLRHRDGGELFRRFPDRLLSRLKPNPYMADLKRYLAQVAGASFRSRILDVGCGGGDLIRRMWETGFQNVTGIDPFLPEQEVIAGELLRCSLDEFEENNFDLIMMHHVLEHDDEPSKLLQSAKARLSPRGVVLVRVPVVAASTWEQFRENWAELDPPRHSYVPTVAALETLGSSVGLHVHRVDYEAEPFTFAASEIASQQEPFADKAKAEHYSQQQWKAFQDTAMDYAKQGQAPRVAVHFCNQPVDGPIVRVAVATFDTTDRPEIPVEVVSS